MRPALLILAPLLLASCSEPTPPAPPGGPVLVATGCAPEADAAVDCTDGPRASPFTCLRFTSDCRMDVQLEVDGAWYRLEGVNGVTVDGIRDIAESACGPIGGPQGVQYSGWKKRLAEDLPALMTGVCRPAGDTVELALRDVDSGAWVTHPDVSATAAKRAAVKGCWPTNDACSS